MPDEIKPDPKQAPTQEAQLEAEAIKTGQDKAKAPKVDIEKDYETAKQYSVSDVDRSGQGEQAAEAATQPEFKPATPQETKTQTTSTGKPDDFIEMAKDITPGA